jgi:isoleucyl-tRNA synthetase
MAPAHGAEDYAVFIAAGLLGTSGSDVVSPVDGNGRYSNAILKLCSDPQHGLRLVGKEVLGDGSQEILSILKEAALLVTHHRYKHRYPYDSRTNQPMIVR